MTTRTSYLIVAAIIVGLIGYGAGCYFWGDKPQQIIIENEPQIILPKDNTDTPTSTTTPTTTPKTVTPTPKKTIQPLSTKPKVIFTGTFLAGDETVLLEYNEADYNKALANKKVVILYFDTAWCALCQQEFYSAALAFNLLTTKDIAGFRVNFNDNLTSAAEQKIAQRFNVTEYHTKVILKNGKHVLTAADIWNTDRYLRAMSSALY